MLTVLRLPILTLVLVVACSRGGGRPSTPQPPRPVLVETPGLCLTQQPPMPTPELLAIADEGTPTPDQEALLWTYLEAVESYAWRAWKLCGRRAVER